MPTPGGRTPSGARTAPLLRRVRQSGRFECPSAVRKPPVSDDAPCATAERFEDHGDDVLVVVHESGQAHGSGASTDATIYAVFTFRDGKVTRYREFYDEAAARAGIARQPSPAQSE